MAFKTLNGYDVEHATSLLVYDNLFPEIQHINGKGVTDKYTQAKDIENVTLIDVTRVLPYAPRFRQLGATNNGAWHNKKNEGGFGNAPQSVHYTIPVDLVYDEGIAITSNQDYSSPVQLKKIVMAQLVKTAGLAINIITFAKQIEGFFRDNFPDTSDAETTITDDQVNSSVFLYTTDYPANQAGSAVDAFVSANAKLTDGCLELGALQIPMEERQAFITPEFDRLMKRQYQTNASDLAVKINASGFINPFTQSESVRVNSATGAAGSYDGVDMFIVNSTTRRWVEIALGLDVVGDTDATHLAILRSIQAMIVYGAGTVRGIVGPSIEANPNVYFGGVYILPKMKVGVEVLNGKSIKVVTNMNWTKEQIKGVCEKIKFTALDGVTVTGKDAFAKGVFNDGSSN